MKKQLLVLALAIATVGGFAFASRTTAQSNHSAQSPACTTSEFRQFDFWVGDWDAFDTKSGAKEARARVTQILGGCALLEDYQDMTGMKGQSFNIYDPSRGVWHQTWVTNRGRLLVIEGKFQTGAMVLTGVDHSFVGKEATVRGIWKSEGDAVRETAERSTDGGKTWTPWFDLLFRPHQGH